MSCPFFFVSKRPKENSSQVQLQYDLYECLKVIADQIKKDGVYVPEVLRPLVRCVIEESVVGPSHIAFRLQDGRVCRISYSLHADKLISISERRKGRTADSDRELPVPRDGSSNSARSISSAVTLRTLRPPLSVLGRSSRSMSFFREIQRQGLYLRPLSSQIAASDVPENLIEQCQMVLQGKSRQAIVRELQRTNLDVNMAVNNLLSREDEADFNSGTGAVGIPLDWEDETEDIFSLLEHSEGLLLDSEGGLQDEIIDRSSSPRFRREVLMDCDRTLGDHSTYTDRRKRRRFDAGFLRNGENYSNRAGISRAMWSYLGISDEKEEESNPDETSSASKGIESSLQLGDRLEFWPTISAESMPSHFISIAALYTELVAVNTRGELHQWKWQSSEPYSPHNINSLPFNLEQPDPGSSGTVNHRHPRALSLGISNEKVVSLSGCITRASIMTASGAIATWVDDILPGLFHSIVPANSAALNAASAALLRLEHPATHFTELKNEQVSHLSVAPLISVVQCASGAVYWWGVLPSYIRQRNVDKQKNPTGSASVSGGASTRHRSVSGGPELMSKAPVGTASTPSLSPGDLVCMRNAPMFHAGAVGFTLANGIPKVGVLLEDSWKLTDVCRFRVKSPSSLKCFSAEKLFAAVSGKCSTALTEAAHASTCPHAQEIAAAVAAAAAFQSDHEPSQLDTGAAEMPPPPSPASSTCSDHSGPVKVSPGTFKRKKAPSTSSDCGNGPSSSRTIDPQQQPKQPVTKSSALKISSAQQHDEEIEDWCLSEVHFVEDGRNQPIGVLLKLDGPIAAVKFLKEQDRACLAARCPASPVCQFINYISKSGNGQNKSFAVPAAISSQSTCAFPGTPHDPFSWFNDCRLLSKSDLVQVKQPSGGGLPQRVPDFVQPTPRHISMGFLTPKPAHLTITATAKKRILSLAPENSRIHAIIGRCSSSEAEKSGTLRYLEYHVFTLNGKTVSSRRLPALSSQAGVLFDGTCENSSYSDITLTCPAERPLLLRDSAGVVFPFLPPSRPGQESWVFPPWLDLPPVQCAALAWINTSSTFTSTTMMPATSSQRESEASQSTTRNNGEGVRKSSAAVAHGNHSDPRLLLGVLVVKETSLLQYIARTDEAKVEEALRSLAVASQSRVESIASEMSDGHRTILHMAVLMCAPLIRETQEMANSIDNILKLNDNGSSVPPNTSDGSGWTTIPPSTQQQLATSLPPLPRSLQSILDLSSAAQRSSCTSATAITTSSSVRDIFIRSSLEAAAAAESGAIATTLSATSSATYFCHLPCLVAVDESARRIAAHRILRAIMMNQQLRRLMPDLLASLSDDGLTPFMLAVQCKAYQVAAFILDFLIEMEGIRSDDSEEAKYQFRYARLMRYLFPSSARLDDSPLFNLSYNDTCSFTWTGPNHIRQDIFECRTCGLMDSLCCCSECARVCHKGHDCRLKRTSPTAYCDCWEKCRCRSLISGHLETRRDLFKRLLDNTDMVYLPNRANDHLMVYLARRVVRQSREQKQYKSVRRRGGGERVRGAGGSSNLDEPEHDLDPPSFSRQALEMTLDSKAAVASLLCDCKNDFMSYPHTRYEDKKNKSADSPCVQAIQLGTALLDEFLFLLICRFPAEFIQRLVNTLARSLCEHLNSERGVRQLLSYVFSNAQLGSSDNPDAFYYCQRGVARFVRSAARIYTGLTLSLSPDYYKKKPRISGGQANSLEMIRSIFCQLAPVALPELASLAAQIISPVRTGALHSSAPFELSSQLQEAIHGFDQLLSSERTNNLRSRQAQSSLNAPLYASSGHGPDCPNSVIRRLIFGFDATDNNASGILPTWINIKRQQDAKSDLSARTSEHRAEEHVEVEEARLSSRTKRRRQISENCGVETESPQPKHRRRHRKRRRHGDSTNGGPHPPPPPPPAPQPFQQPPAIVVESTNSTASTNPFAEMEFLPVPSGDSDTDADVRSNELDSNATMAAEHRADEEDEDFSETASEDEAGAQYSRQLEAPGSQHSSISSTAATAGTTGSIILDTDTGISMPSATTTSQQQGQEVGNSANAAMEEDNTMVVTTYCGSDEEDEVEEGEENAEEEDVDDMQMHRLAASIRHSFSRRQQQHQRRRRHNEMSDDDDDDDESGDGEEEDEDIGDIEEDEDEVGVEEEDEDDEDDGDSEDEEEEEDEEIEGEEDDDDETEEEDEEEMEVEDEDVVVSRGLLDDERDHEEQEEDAYSQESDPSRPPSPYAPWGRRRVSGSGPSGGSSATTANAQSTGTMGNPGDESTSIPPLTTTTSTTSVSRPISASSSALARLYSAALSSAFDRRAGRNTSLNSLTGWTPFGAPLSPSQGNNSTSADPAASSNGNAGNGNNTVSSTAPVGAPSNAPLQAVESSVIAEVSEMKNVGIHVTEVQLSRAMGSLLRLIADVMADLVNQDGDAGEEDSEDSDIRLRRSVSAPILLTPPIGMLMPRKWRALTRNKNGMVQGSNGYLLTPLRSLVIARPANSVSRALICAAMGSTLAPIWTWISECLDDLEIRLRARLAWNSRRPNISAPEFLNVDSGGSKRRKENVAESAVRSGPQQSQQPSAGENQVSSEVRSGSGGSTMPVGVSDAVATDGGVVIGAATGTESGTNKSSANRQQMLSYLLSLMRTMHNEHGPHAPAVNIFSYKHAAYLLDAFIYFFRVFECTWPSGLMHHLVQLQDSLTDDLERMELDEESEQSTQSRLGLFQDHPVTQRTNSFFRRSTSTLCLTGVPLDTILFPASESMPLAATPQLLQPGSERSDWFGTVKNRKADSDFLTPEKVGDSAMDDESRAQHYIRIGKAFKDIKLGERIIWGGEFLDSVCHTGSTMSRWNHSLDAFASAFFSDIGAEPRSYMLERLSFTEKEARFRKEMERLRSYTKYDLTLEVDREASALILTTATQLNNELSSRLTQSAVYGHSLLMRDSASSSYLDLRMQDTAVSPQSSLPNVSSGVPVLLSRRVKVIFKGEPGEGSGVTRSFISAFAEAVTANSSLPDLSPLYASVTGSVMSRSLQPETLSSRATPSSLMAATSRLFTRLRLPLTNSNSAAFDSTASGNTSHGANTAGTTSTVASATIATALIGSAATTSRSRRSEVQAARALFRSPYTSSVSFNLAPSRAAQSEETEAFATETPSRTTPVDKPAAVETASALTECVLEGPERAPLFWQPGHNGFFSPRGIANSLSADSPALLARLSLYRCVGRVIALALLHAEICPIRFNRHVLKYILGRPLCWHDFAFYNVNVFEGLRQILLPVARGDAVDAIPDFGLNFSLVLAPEEGGSPTDFGVQVHQLVPGGDEIDVGSTKVYEYVKRYTEFKMLEVVKDSLEQIRLGVFDVLPANALDGLTPEDLRLLLNGIVDVDVDLLSSYTTFIDESNCGASLAAAEGGVQPGGEGAADGSVPAPANNVSNSAKERIERLKRWFWNVIRGMNPRQRQDLLYFWTSSPALPPSALSFEPAPTIVIRPADDQHLPTANTCISRLYLPLYSSRQILREKLLAAIETRCFGFV